MTCTLTSICALGTAMGQLPRFGFGVSGSLTPSLHTTDEIDTERDLSFFPINKQAFQMERFFFKVKKTTA